jgi:hypothetical protein
MRRISAHLTSMHLVRAWPAIVGSVEFLMLGAAMGLIAAIVIGAPHLRLP